LGVQGKVFVTFVVEVDGSITDVKVLRGIGSGCDDEAIVLLNPCRNGFLENKEVCLSVYNSICPLILNFNSTLKYWK